MDTLDVTGKLFIWLIVSVLVALFLYAELRVWHKAQRQVQQIAEEYPFAEFYCDLCQFANATYSEQEAYGIYLAWQERILTREEVAR